MEGWIISVFGDLLSLLLLYKYVALFVIGYLAAFVLPIPASTTLAAAGGFASLGYFSITYVLLTAFFANILGDATGYLLARRYGKQVFTALRIEHVLHTSLYKKLENYMLSFPHSVIFISRFLTEIGPAISMLSGLTRVNYVTFFSFAVLGEISYVLLYGFAGYYLGSEWESNIGFLFKAGMTIVSIGVMLNIIQWAIYKRHNKHTPANN